MNKLLLSILIFTSSLFLTDVQAGSQPLGCKFHNSRKCVDPEVFEKELEIGCASPSGNCRSQFCKANCLNIGDTTRRTLSLCKKNCFDPSLLARFDSPTRETLYGNFLPSEERSGKSARYNARKAYGKESAVQAAKAKQWWSLGRAPKNTQLYQKLEAEYQRLISAKVKRLQAAEARQDRRAAAKLRAEVTIDIEEATETLAQPQQLPPVVAKAQEDLQSPELSPRQKALVQKVVNKWWGSIKGKKEAKRVQQERAQVAQTLVQEVAAPADVLPETNRLSGTWKEGPEGRYFIPKAPPLPQSDKIKRLSMELRRQSASFDNLPPPPPPSGDESMGEDQPMPPPPPVDDMMGIMPPPPPPPMPTGMNVPPPPPMMPAGWKKGYRASTAGMNVPPPPPMPTGMNVPPPPPPPPAAMQRGPALNTDLQAEIQAGKKLRPVSSSDEDVAMSRSPSPAAAGGRGALLTQIQRGTKLKKVDTSQQKRVGSPAPGSKEEGLLAALKSRRFFIQDDDDEKDSGKESEDDEWPTEE